MGVKLSLLLCVYSSYPLHPSPFLLVCASIGVHRQEAPKAPVFLLPKLTRLLANNAVSANNERASVALAPFPLCWTFSAPTFPCNERTHCLWPGLNNLHRTFPFRFGNLLVWFERLLRWNPPCFFRIMCKEVLHVVGRAALCSISAQQ